MTIRGIQLIHEESSTMDRPRLCVAREALVKMSSTEAHIMKE